MESNVETAVRIFPLSCPNGDTLCVQPDFYNNTIHLGNSHCFPVQYALPMDCTQHGLFTSTITPLINYLFEGCDVSVITFGQSCSGKSYTLLGPAFNCALSEKEYGVIPRFLREVFSNICHTSDKTYLIHISWTQISGENVQDLLGSGSVECRTVSDAFELLHLGMSNIGVKYAHSLFTITLEQQYFIDGLVQHKISTASFVDLASSEKMFAMENNGLMQPIPTDTGLFTLHKCIWALSEPYVSLNNLHSVIPYNQSALTLLLRDSFGGRAKTLLICCVSPLLSNYMETYYTLQFALRAQMIKNFVTINSYTSLDTMFDNTDVFGLQFATNQLFKLVSNAENLFKNLIVTNSLSKSQIEQISQWLTLKQECEDCISETSEPRRSLHIIEEEIEDSIESISEESEIVCEDDTQTVLQDFDKLIDNFYTQTDTLVSLSNKKDISATLNTKESNNSCSSKYHYKGARGRRPSIHYTEEIGPLNVKQELDTTEEILHQTISKKESDTTHNNLPDKVKQKIFKQICAEIEGCEKQMNELVLTIQMKEKLMDQLLKQKNTKLNIRNQLHQRCEKLQNDQFLAHSKLLEAKSQNDSYNEYKYDLEISDITKRLQDTELIKGIAKDDARKITELESSLNTSKKQLEKLRKHKKKEEKRKINIENDLKCEKRSSCKKSNDEKSKSARAKKSSENIRCNTNSKKLCLNDYSTNICSNGLSSDSIENLKHEIKELRKTREYLLEQRSKIDGNTNNRRILQNLEERQVLQSEEAIETIDLAIEYKNQQICGCAKLVECKVEDQQDKTEKMLMGHFMKLGVHEIRFLLQKYFEKVIDLRSTSKKLEQQLIEIESQNESFLSQVRNLNRVIQRVRSEAERRILLLQQQYEDKLQLMMHHLSKEGIDGDRVMSHVVERSKQAALAFQVSQGGDKQVDKGSLIARFTRYARHETVPRQLQAATTPSQAKVTRQKNKLIIQQSSK